MIVVGGIAVELVAVCNQHVGALSAAWRLVLFSTIACVFVSRSS